MGLIYSLCRQKGAFLINDVSGSIGTELARFGDMVIGSFGDKKPLSIGYGGFLAYDSLSFDQSILDDAVFEKDKIDKLTQKLEELPDRLRFLEKYTRQALRDLSEFEILHKNPVLIERPIVVYNQKAAIGRPPGNVLEIL